MYDPNDPNNVKAILHDWATSFAELGELTSIATEMPGIPETLCLWTAVLRRYRPMLNRDEDAEILQRIDALDRALTAAREPFDPQRPHVRGWGRVLSAGQELVESLTDDEER